MEPAEQSGGGRLGGRGRLIGVAVGAAVGVGIVILLILGLVRHDQTFTIDRNISENKAPTAPNFTLPVLAAAGGVGPEGATASLSSLRGHPVVVNLWASWCGPCKEEAPLLEKLWQDYRAKGVIVLGVNNEDTIEKAKGFIATYGITFPSLRDGTNRTEQAYETTGMPETFIIDPDGKMRILPVRGQLTAPLAQEIAAHLDTVVKG